MPKVLLGNVKGDKGDPGTSINIKGYYDSKESLSSAHPQGEMNDAYNVGGTIYVWDPENSEWKEVGIEYSTIGEITGELNLTEGDPYLSVDVNEHLGVKNVQFNFTGGKMKGATEHDAGGAGFVPAPKAGDTNKFLRSDGEWAEVSGSGSGAVTDPSQVEIPNDFSGMSWQQVYDLGKKIETKPSVAYKLIGKEIEFETTGNGTFHAQLVALGNHDRADGSGKAVFTFMTKECTSTGYKLNETAVNAGGYPGSNFCRTIMPTILESFPAELKNLITEVNIPYNMYRQKEGATGDENFIIMRTIAKLFLPSNRELFGPVPLSTSGYAGDNYLTGEDGKQFDYFTRYPGLTYLIKNKTGTETPANWWTRSCYSNTASFVYVHANGSVNINGASSEYSVAPCFCIC